MHGRIPVRRRFLALCGGSLMSALAGCNGIMNGDETPTNDASPSGTVSTAAGPPNETGTSGPGPDVPESSESPMAGSDVSGSPESPTAGSDGQTPAGNVHTQVYRETIDSVVLVSLRQGQGTGFVYDDSHIVTNAHVVSGATTAEVRFNDGTWSEGEVVGRDFHSDLAVIAVETVPEPATPLQFLQVAPTTGQRVVVIGNPYNLGGSITTGIISGTDRSIPSPAGYRIPDAIQTDAAVNPGNSGGPLMSLAGTVVGVVNSGGGDNIAFGISAALTQRVVPRLIENGEYDHATLGVSYRNVSPRIADANNLSEPRGLIVASVRSGGPADGVLQPSESQFIEGQRVPVDGDVILAIDGTRVTTSEELASYLALETRPGDGVTLRILRGRIEQTVVMELGSRPERTTNAPSA
jgi:S1-C subfamily serine protease